ncbi:hypothetical protein L914_00421, partial [Phytophthora nicotianae]
NRNKDQENQLSLIGPLSAKYGDDTVATMLVDLKKNPELAKLAKQLQDQQLTDWLKNGKSGGDIFSLLKLKDDGNIGSQKLQVLEDYLTIVNTKKSTDETLLNVLTKGFGGESNLVPLLAKAGIDPLMVDKSKKLEAALLTKWRDDNVPRLTVWVRLKFDDNLDEALSSGKMGIFSSMYLRTIQTTRYQRSRKSLRNMENLRWQKHSPLRRTTSS